MAKAQILVVDISNLTTAQATLQAAVAAQAALGYVLDNTTFESERDANGDFKTVAVLSFKEEGYLSSANLRTLEAVYQNSADSAAAGATGAEEFFLVTQYTLPAGKAKIGDYLDLYFRASITGTMAGGGNMRFRLYIAGVVVEDQTLVACATGDQVGFHVRVKLRAGATSEVQGVYYERYTGAGTDVAYLTRLAGLTIDPTVANLVRASITATIANAGNTATLRELDVTVAHS